MSFEFLYFGLERLNVQPTADAGLTRRLAVQELPALNFVSVGRCR